MSGGREESSSDTTSVASDSSELQNVEQNPNKDEPANESEFESDSDTDSVASDNSELRDDGQQPRITKPSKEDTQKVKPSKEEDENDEEVKKLITTLVHLARELNAELAKLRNVPKYKEVVKTIPIVYERAEKNKTSVGDTPTKKPCLNKKTMFVDEMKAQNILDKMQRGKLRPLLRDVGMKLLSDMFGANGNPILQVVENPEKDEIQIVELWFPDLGHRMHGGRHKIQKEELEGAIKDGEVWKTHLKKTVKLFS